jgi:hypothetical protein
MRKTNYYKHMPPKRNTLQHDTKIDPGEIPRRRTALTTAGAMMTQPTTVLISSRIDPATANARLTNAAIWKSAKAALTGGPPIAPDYITFGDARTASSLALACGLYILAAPTGAGKTVLSMALTGWANDSGIPATYVSCFEPRCPTIKGTGTELMVDPSAFWNDADGMFVSNPNPKMVIFDSATLPLKAYASSKIYNNQATFPGGLQPSDRGFLERGYALSRKYNACIIININSISIPYVAQLAAATEGMLTLSNVASFSYADRSPSSKREMRSVTIPVPYVDAALDYFGFGSFTPSTSRGFTSSFIGTETLTNL